MSVVIATVLILIGTTLLLDKVAAYSNAEGTAGAITFSKDVAPILRARCEECHHSGGVAPMSLVTYSEARPWARAIKEKVVRREMPPFHALGPLGRYQNDPRLTDAEVATISSWVDSGAKEGNSADLPPRKQWDFGWAFGTPDLVVTQPKAFTLAKNDKDLYVFFVFDYVFPEDTWINSIQVRPGNARAVHHANVHLVPPGFKVPEEGYIAGDFDPSARGTYMISGWVPGANTVKLTDGVAVRIPKGMRLGLQVHYAPSGQAISDQSSIGVYYADGIVQKNLRLLFGDRKDLLVQPGEANASFTDRKTFQTDAIIKFFHVHMHLRGKSYVMKLYYPDGRVETGLEVQNYNFNWQRTYVLTEPIRVPKGTIAEFTGTYDNSDKNRFNPDPTQPVRWGEFTKDEMMQGRIFYEAADEKLNLRVVKGRAVPAEEPVSKSQ